MDMLKSSTYENYGYVKCSKFNEKNPLQMQIGNYFNIKLVLTPCVVWHYPFIIHTEEFQQTKT